MTRGSLPDRDPLPVESGRLGAAVLRGKLPHLRLQTGDGKPLFLIESPDGTYRLTPYDPAFERKMAKAEDIIGRYQNALHKLAK